MADAPIAADASTRTRWIDVARGIGILLVVYGHAQRALFPLGRVPAWAAILDRTIYAFHMPLFFVLAGLFVWPSLAKGRGRFVADKLVTVVYPYFLWSLIEGGMEVVLTGEVNTPLSLHDLATIPVAPIEQFWFLYVLALCFAVALACWPRRPAIVAVAGLGMVAAGTWGVVPILLRTLAFFPYVAIGIVAAAPVLALGRDARRALAVLILSLFVFVVGLATACGGFVSVFVVAVAGSLAALAAAVQLDRSPAGRWLALLGRASLAIYVMHTIFSAGLRIAVRGTALSPPIPVMLAATLAAGVGGPLCVWLVAERLGVVTLMGLGRPTRRRARPPIARPCAEQGRSGTAAAAAPRRSWPARLASDGRAR